MQEAKANSSISKSPEVAPPVIQLIIISDYLRSTVCFLGSVRGPSLGNIYENNDKKVSIGRKGLRNVAQDKSTQIF